MSKMPTGFYLCQSIFYGFEANHDELFRHRQSLPSKGRVADSESLECYAIGKAHRTEYSCALGASPQGYHYKVLLSSDPLTRCFQTCSPHHMLSLRHKYDCHVSPRVFSYWTCVSVRQQLLCFHLTRKGMRSSRYYTKL